MYDLPWENVSQGLTLSDSDTSDVGMYQGVQYLGVQAIASMPGNTQAGGGWVGLEGG